MISLGKWAPLKLTAMVALLLFLPRVTGRDHTTNCLQGKFATKPPRLLRLRQRMARLEEQRQQLAEEATRHTELQLIIGRLEDFAATVRDGLEEADWASKRDLIRTLVKRVEVARDQVNIVFRIDPYPSDNDPEKKS